MWKQCVFCETGTDVLAVIQRNIVIQRAKGCLACPTRNNRDISGYVYNLYRNTVHVASH